MMINDYLSRGKASARTCGDIARATGCTAREITAQIERERRAGYPICASTGDPPGYYLAETPEELAEYCEALRRRAIEVLKTRKALIKVLEQMTK